MSRECSLRLAHMTDVHVQPERGAGAGLSMALEHMRGLHVVPELLLNGGDAIMNCTGEAVERADVQWDVWHRALARVDFAVAAREGERGRGE